MYSPYDKKITMDIGHLPRDADLVEVEVIGLLAALAVFVGPVAYLRQGFVAVGIGVDIGISAVQLDFLQEVDQFGGLSKGS